MNIEAKCKAIYGMDNDVRLKKYEELVKQLLQERNVSAMIKFVEHLVKVEGASQHGRTYITPDALKYFIAQVGRSDDEMKDFLNLEKKWKN